MATYAVQFITQQGAICGSQRVTNRAHALKFIDEWNPRPDKFAVHLLIVGGSFKERTTLGDLAVSDVFYNRRDARAFLSRLQPEEGE